MFRIILIQSKVMARYLDILQFFKQIFIELCKKIKCLQ